MIFRSERNVRDWLRRSLPGRVWWVEYGRGGSVGLPDAIVADKYGAAFLELKLAKKNRFRASPVQILTLRKMQSAGLRAMLVAGVEGTGLIGIVWNIDKITGHGMYSVGAWDLLFEAKEGWPEVPR